MNIFKGKKVRLRAVEASDLENYYLKTNGDTDSVRNSDRMIFPVSIGLRQKRIQDLSEVNPYSDDYTLIIETLEGDPVGNINSHSCNRVDGIFSYGLGILSDYRSLGYASEAIDLFCKYFFLELDYKKVEVKIYAFNEASIALHEKLGFVLEGTLRSNHYAKGQRWDTYIYGCLREEMGC